MKTRVAASMVVVCCMLSACRGDAAQGGMVTDTIGGVPSAMSSAQGALGDTVPWRLEQYLVIAADQLYDRKPTVLAVDVGILPAGGVVVLDASNNRVLRFDSLGAYIGSFGEEGSGPGEFTAPFFLEAANSEIYVLDTELNRVTAFDTSGTFLRRFQVNLGGLVGTSGVFVAGGPGELYMAGEPAPVVGTQDTGRAVLLHVNNDGSIGDTVLSYPASGWTPIQRADGGTSYAKPRFAPEPHLSAVPGLVAVSVSPRYTVEIRRPDGSLVRRVAREYENVAVTEAMRDSVLSLMVQGGLPRESLEHLPFARVIPAIERMVLDDQGRLWVKPYMPDEPLRRDVFDAEGRYLGPIYLPLPMRLEDVEGDRACGVVVQPSGATAVVCYRIRTAGGGS